MKLNIQSQTKWVLVIGIVLTFLVFRLSTLWEQQKWKDRFNGYVHDATLILTGKLEVNKQVLISVRSLFDASRHVDRQEFRVFVKPLLEGNRYIQALGWIPKVTASERPIIEAQAQKDGFPQFQISQRFKQGEMIRETDRSEYFPVFYLEPYSGNEMALGFDLTSNLVRMESLDLARDTGRPVATRRIFLVQEKQRQAGTLVLVPVYKNRDVPNEIEARQSNLKGFIVGTYRMDDMMKQIIVPHLEKGMNLVVYGEDESHEENILFGKFQPQASFEVRNSLKFSGQQWNLLWQALPEFSREYATSSPQWFAVGFLLFFLFLAVIAEINVSRNRVRKVIQNTWNGILTMDSDGTIETFNSATIRLFGYKPRDLKGKNLSHLIPELNANQPGEFFKHHFPSDQDMIVGSLREVQAQRKDGTRFPVEIGVTEIKSEGESLFTAVIHDVTNRKQIEKDLEALSQTDGLTGIHNRRYFDSMIRSEWNRAARESNPLSLIMMDIDHFKKYNDHYGHPQGDHCLKQVAQTMSNHLRRPGDVLARYGGEEFVALIPGMEASKAMQFAEFLRQEVEDLRLEHKKSDTSENVTISLGVVSLNDPNNYSLENFIKTADKALYLAKSEGRNRFRYLTM